MQDKAEDSKLEEERLKALIERASDEKKKLILANGALCVEKEKFKKKWVQSDSKLKKTQDEYYKVNRILKKLRRRETTEANSKDNSREFEWTNAIAKPIKIIITYNIITYYVV